MSQWKGESSQLGRDSFKRAHQEEVACPCSPKWVEYAVTHIGNVQYREPPVSWRPVYYTQDKERKNKEYKIWSKFTSAMWVVLLFCHWRHWVLVGLTWSGQTTTNLLRTYIFLSKNLLLHHKLYIIILCPRENMSKGGKKGGTSTKAQTKTLR